MPIDDRVCRGNQVILALAVQWLPLVQVGLGDPGVEIEALNPEVLEPCGQRQRAGKDRRLALFRNAAWPGFRKKQKSVTARFCRVQ